MEKKIEDYLHLYLGCECFCNIPEIEVPQRVIIDGDLLSKKGKEFFKNVKPILRPLSDIKQDEAIEVCKMANINYNNDGLDEFYDLDGFKSEIDVLLKNNDNSWNIALWLLSKHFDLFGLIESGLAIDKSKL